MATPSNPIMGADNTQSVPAVPVAANPPAAPAAPAIDTSTLNGGAPAMPISSPSPAPPPATPPPAQGQPSVWKNLVMGAIYGLAGSQGATHFGGGAAGGAAGYVAGKQKEIENERAQQQLEAQKQQFQFASIKAADDHIRAVNEARAADNANTEAQQAISDHAMQSRAFANFYGIAPTTIEGNSSDELHQKAVGVMQDSASPNGGQIPRVSTISMPDGGDEATPHAIDAYHAPSPLQLQSNPNGSLGIVNDYRAVRGLPPYSPQDWRSAAGSQMPTSPADMPKVMPAIAKWQSDQVADAQKGMLEVPQTSQEKDPDKAAAQDASTLNTLKAQLTRYQAGPSPDDRIVKQLQSQIDGFEAMAGSASDQRATAAAKVQNQITMQTAGPQAAAGARKAQAEQLAKESTPGGQLEIANKQQELNEKQNEPVLVYDPNHVNADGSKGANTVVPVSQAQAAGLPHYKVDPELVNANIAGFNDVQNKINMLSTVANDPAKMSKVNGQLAAQLLKEGAGLKLDAFGLEAGTEAQYINTKDYQTQIARANPETREYVVALIAAHEAVTQLPRLQTFGKSSRMTEQQMEAAIRMLPAPADDPDMAQRKMISLQTTIDPLRKQMPVMPGADLIPTWLDQQKASAGQQAAPAAPPAAPATGVQKVTTKKVDALRRPGWTPLP